MISDKNISASRRRFLSNGIKLGTFSILLLPFQKALSSGIIAFNTSIDKLHKFFAIDKLVLNIKTGVVHLPIGRIFSKYPTIRRRKLISSTNWDVEVKSPYHFHKEKSGIILETLALTSLAGGITDQSLTDAYRILSIAFTGTYKNKTGAILNKYNFRLHHLLLQVIALNSTFGAAQKWEKFQSATGKINYNLQDKKPLPKFMGWIKNKADFDKKVNYILQNRSTYTSRLEMRTSRSKL